jgi:hypothetical protein
MVSLIMALFDMALNPDTPVKLPYACQCVVPPASQHPKMVEDEFILNKT